MLLASPSADGLKEALRQIDVGLIRIVLDPHSPFEFTEQDAKRAFCIQESRRAHGKLVFVVGE